MVFDVLSKESNGDLRVATLSQRKQVLAKLIIPNDRVFLIDYDLCYSTQEIKTVFDRRVREGFEGVVVKPDRCYRAKWLKLKKEETLDVAVLGVKKTKLWLEQAVPQTFLVGFYDDVFQTFRRFGYVSSGLTFHEKNAIGELVPDLKVREDRKNVYLKPFVVLEISYQERLKNGFRHPRILRIRLDKSPKECKRG